MLLAPLRVDDDEDDCAAQGPRRGGVSRHPDPPADLELARHRLLDDAVRHVPRDAGHPRQARGGAGEHVCDERLDGETETFATQRPLPPARHERPADPPAAGAHDRLRRDPLRAWPSRYAEYAQRGGKGYEIEHIWADHPERHTDEFTHPSDFQEYRNRIGGLLLLPKSFNASYGDLPYAKKREHYDSQNLLARSLHEEAYDHNPGFLRFIGESGLPFRPHPEFRKADLDARQELYRPAGRADLGSDSAWSRRPRREWRTQLHNQPTEQATCGRTLNTRTRAWSG